MVIFEAEHHHTGPAESGGIQNLAPRSIAKMHRITGLMGLPDY